MTILLHQHIKTTTASTITKNESNLAETNVGISQGYSIHHIIHHPTVTHQINEDIKHHTHKQTIK